MAVIPIKKKYHISQDISAISFNSSYSVVDPDSSKAIANFREETTLKQAFSRLFLDRAFLSASLALYNVQGDKLLDIYRLASVFASHFVIKNHDGKILCTVKQRLSLFNPGIDVFDAQNRKLGTIEGGWKFKNFLFKDTNDNTVAKISHKFEGIKDLLTTADSFDLSITGDDSITLIALALVICIDIIYHES